MVRHEATHYDVRPHVCNICQKTYKRSTHLRRHEKSAHGIVSSTRRVQRLKDEDDANVTTTKAKKTNNKKDNQKMLLVDSGVLTFEIANSSILNINQVVSDESSIFISNELNFDPSQSGLNNVLQDIENSTTCDILLPENINNENTENYLQNPYQYL